MAVEFNNIKKRGLGTLGTVREHLGKWWVWVPEESRERGIRETFEFALKGSNKWLEGEGQGQIQQSWKNWC